MRSVGLGPSCDVPDQPLLCICAQDAVPIRQTMASYPSVMDFFRMTRPIKITFGGMRAVALGCLSGHESVTYVRFTEADAAPFASQVESTPWNGCGNWPTSR